MTPAQLASAYTGNKVLHLQVNVTSVNPKGRKVNFTIGDTSQDTETIYAYPKGSKKLSVKLANKGKVEWSSSKSSVSVKDDFINDKNATIKVGKTTLKPSTQLNEKLLTFRSKDLTDSYGDPIYQTGTYYVAVMPDEKTMVSTNVYCPTAVKVDFTGTKLTKKLINLETTKKDGTGAAQDWKLVTSLTKDKDFEAYLIDAYGKERYITLTGPTNGAYTFNNGTLKDWDEINIDQGAGKYNIVIKGCGQYSGELKLTYSYSKVAITKLGYKLQVNDGAAVVFDPSNQYANVKLAILDKDGKTVKVSAANKSELLKNTTLAIKSITFSGTKVGTGAGTATIVFKDYSGKLTAKFDIAKLAVTSADVRRASMYAGENTPRVFMARAIDKVDYEFKKGSDYVVTNFTKVSDTQGRVDIEIPEKSRLKGSTMSVPFPIYQKKVTDLAIKALSENQGLSANGKTVIAISYNSAKQYYSYEGKQVAVQPLVMKVTANYDGQETEIAASNYDVIYTPVKDANGNYIKGKYSVKVMFNENSGKTYPSYMSSKPYTYTVSDALQ